VGKVVFCEDDPILQRVITAALYGSPHEVALAADGVEGLRLIQQVRPNVVFTDLQMPRMGGSELAAALKGDPDLAAIPIVFMTASAERSEINELPGAAGVLAKPFTASELRARLDEFLTDPEESS
jgi:CheY-like chemotaxis protein